MNAILSIFLALVLIELNFTFAHEDSSRARFFDTKIYNGYPAEIANAKHQVSIRMKAVDSIIFGLGHLCGGSLITPRVVLTAAHCLRNPFDMPWNEKLLNVVMGTLWRNITNNDTLMFDVKSFVLHPGYNSTSLSNDVACVFMAGEVPANHPTTKPIQLVAIPVGEDILCQVTGWGLTEKDDELSDILLAVDVRIIDINTCNQGYEGVLPVVGQICAGYMTGGRDACTGDSGGPLVCNGKLTGIVSSGVGCGEENKPGIYTDVLYFENWIRGKSNGIRSKQPSFTKMAIVLGISSIFRSGFVV